MEVVFADADLDRLEVDPRFTAGHGGPVVRAYRRVMQAIRAAVDERDLYALKGLRLEKLKGDRRQQHSLRLNGQWRLIVEFEGEGASKKVRVVEIVDYH